MTPDERQLITGLFDRMQGLGPVQKDREAEALISDAVRRFPDSPYLLVQSVLIQEQALKQGEERINELQQRLDDLERQSRAPQQESGGSFLGGLFGTSKPAAPPARSIGGSVPSTGRSFGQPQYNAPQAGSPWGTPQGQPQYQQGQPQGGQPWAQPQAPAGGGFLRQAATTAAGVAGGMLVANAIGNMFGGHAAQAAGGGLGGGLGGVGGTPATPSVPITGAPENQPISYTDDNNDPGNYDPNDPASGNDAGNDHASYDDSDNDPGGGDWGGGDTDA